MTALGEGRLAPRAVGRTGVRVSPLGLGGGALGGLYDAVSAPSAIEAVGAAYEHGVRYFDTAPLYGHGRSEERVGEALAGLERSSFALSTKVGVVIAPRTGPDEQLAERYADPFVLDGHYDFSYDACLRSLEQSMARLRTDRLDIVYIHDPDEGDSAVPPAERRGVEHVADVMDGCYRALHDLRDQGVVGAVGIGLNGTDLLVRFAHEGDFDCFLLAGRYTLLEQNGLDDLLPLCLRRGISIVVGGVFNSGILATGAAAPAPMYDYRPAGAAVLARVREIEELCAEHGVPLPALALQFPLAHPAVAAVIPGARSVVEAADNVEAVAHEVPPELWAQLRRRGLVAAGAPLPGTDQTLTPTP